MHGAVKIQHLTAKWLDRFCVCLSVSIGCNKNDISHTKSSVTSAQRFAWPQAALQSPLFKFAVSCDPDISVRFNAVNIRSFIHLVACLTTGPKPLPKRAVHTVLSRASSVKWEYPLLSLSSSSSFRRLLPRLPVTSIPTFIFPSITCCRRQFLRKMCSSLHSTYLKKMLDSVLYFGLWFISSPRTCCNISYTSVALFFYLIKTSSLMCTYIVRVNYSGRNFDK